MHSVGFEPKIPAFQRAKTFHALASVRPRGHCEPFLPVDAIDTTADHSGRPVWGINCFRSLERCDREFESHSRHRCLYCVHLFCVRVALCVGWGLVKGWSPVQGVLQSVYRLKKLKNWPSPNKGLYSHNNNNDKVEQQINTNIRKL
jgi:hypothetical protein